MRSNDAYIGLPHDVFCFTMLQELVARDLGVELGCYRHLVGSLHIYEADFDGARQFVDEGWQSTVDIMPEMPRCPPWPAVAVVLEAEKAIRNGVSFDDAKLDAVDGYWVDLVRLLQAYRCKKDGNLLGITSVRERMNCKLYSPFIDRLIH
jgi:thymidylate synthase